MRNETKKNIRKRITQLEDDKMDKQPAEIEAFKGDSSSSPGNLASAVLIPSAFIAGQRSLGSHNDKFVSLSANFPLFSTR